MVLNREVLPQRHGVWALLKKAMLILLSEAALKFHLFLYWLICLFSMMEEQQGLHTLRVMLVAMSIVFALLAMITGTACFFYPFLFVIVDSEQTIFVRNNKFATTGLDMLVDNTKMTREDDEILYIWNGFSCVYFAILATTLIKNITDYQINEVSVRSY
ncbi:hypothetical protein ANCCAN_07852 [Ancylostoma caninum]|uniref:Uncharacterized protein n=1 Tax=Ancylostoma caninum TaxID=29170 RepID=A0A368GSR5_ANCCA|nr:hypothetical protein ANCCAN_07852 [Ancylostoma caninum]